MTTTTAHPLVDRLMALWAEPIEEEAVALTRFAELYHDPVVVNGASLPLTALVARAADMHRAFHREDVDILDVVHDDGRVAVAFQMVGRHIGTYHSSAGDIAATGRPFRMQVIDILGLRDGRIETIIMVADEAGLLAQLNAE